MTPPVDERNEVDLHLELLLIENTQTAPLYVAASLLPKKCEVPAMETMDKKTRYLCVTNVMVKADTLVFYDYLSGK
jgi:hypothetical protein